RLVGNALSAGQFPTTDGATVRWLPFGKLRYREKDRHRVERRLRALPRRWQRPCHGKIAGDDSEPGAHELRRCERHLHPMSFAGATVEESDQRQVLRLAGGLQCGPQTAKLLAAGRAQAWRTQLYTLPRWHCA